MLIISKFDDYCGNGNKKALIHFKNKFPGLKESTVRTFQKQHQEELKKARSQKGSPRKFIEAKQRKEGGRYFLVGLIERSKIFLKKHQISWWSSQNSNCHSSCQCFG